MLLSRSLLVRMKASATGCRTTATKDDLLWFALMKNHIGLYLRPPVIAEHKRELTAYKTTKSAIHFALDKKLPIPLIKKLVKARMKKNEAERAATKNS